MALDPSTKDGCAERIAKRSGLSPDAAARLLIQVADAADEMRRTGQSDPIVAAAHDLASRMLEEAKKKTAEAELDREYAETVR